MCTIPCRPAVQGVPCEMSPPPPLVMLPVLVLVMVVVVQDTTGCYKRHVTDVGRRLSPRTGRAACYLLPLKNHKRIIRETTKPFGECCNSTITILVDGRFRCVEKAVGRLARPTDAMSCADDGVLYMLGLNHVVGTQMAARPVASGKRFVCYQLQRPERDPLFWRTHLERTDLGFYYCKALYGFGTARVALYLVADPDNVRHGFCFFAGGATDIPRTVEPRWCHLSVGGVVAFRAWET